MHPQSVAVAACCSVRAPLRTNYAERLLEETPHQWTAVSPSRSDRSCAAAAAAALAAAAAAAAGAFVHLLVAAVAGAANATAFVFIAAAAAAVAAGCWVSINRGGRQHPEG